MGQGDRRSALTALRIHVGEPCWVRARTRTGEAVAGQGDEVQNLPVRWRSWFLVSVQRQLKIQLVKYYGTERTFRWVSGVLLQSSLRQDGALRGGSPPLSDRSQPLSAGEIISSGTLTAGHPTDSGDSWRVEVDGLALPSLTLRLG